MKTYTAVALVIAVSVLQGCAVLGHDVETPRVSAEVAVTQFAMGRVKLLDVRAPPERVGREIAGAIHVQFGRNRWDERGGDLEREEFLSALARVVNKSDEVFVICNYDVRSTAAVRLMRAHGYLNAVSIAGGYMGTHGDPGWQFFE